MVHYLLAILREFRQPDGEPRTFYLFGAADPIYNQFNKDPFTDKSNTNPMFVDTSSLSSGFARFIRRGDTYSNLPHQIAQVDFPLRELVPLERAELAEVAKSVLIALGK